MKQELIDLIKNTIILECNLPCHPRIHEKTVLSTKDDNCFKVLDSVNLSKVIYNNIINYAYDVFEMLQGDEVLLTKALYSRIRYNHKASSNAKLGYGFYGEVLLHALLHVIYKVPPLISKGHFFIAGNGESKGYDSYHIVEAHGQVHLWFGEAKFRETSSSSIKTALEGLSNKVLTDKYFLENNFIPIFDEMSKNTNYDALLAGSKLLDIKTDWIEKGIINIDDFKANNIGIVYPIMIAFKQSAGGYDKSITNCLDYIKKNYAALKFDKLSIDRTIFFIFIPMEKVKDVKKTVIKWIESKEQLI
ncbi:Hachiman antiphage defense system protein HamA [Flavobacterium sp. H122]|uniref:Hachiman antiphage defense system protein HamA n=1 Tax=Flavobacterium sp. H122 TaxID=2529860 RepID=UPI00145A2C41|nr:Hachiman antiphage defense system protein HamA [Flavobacterium sp. H122]